jgi:hypothetical protein
VAPDRRAGVLRRYALVSRKLTGGGIVDPQIITRGFEPTYTVAASVLAGLLAFAV